MLDATALLSINSNSATPLFIIPLLVVILVIAVTAKLIVSNKITKAKILPQKYQLPSRVYYLTKGITV